MVISYCITAKDEAAELERLLSHLKKHIRETDEVIIQLDINHTTEVLEVCNLYTGFNHEQDLHNTIKNSQFYIFALDGNFAQFKNQLFRFAKGDYLFFIDADEIPNENLIEILPSLLQANNTLEVCLVPRENFVEGITQEHLNKWGWKLDEKGRNCWPDYQWRIAKNIPKIRWKNKVHEVLDGFETYTYLPDCTEYSLLHVKDIKKQEKQNNFYNTL